MDGQTVRQTDGQKKEWMDNEWIDGQKDERTGEQTDGQTDKRREGGRKEEWLDDWMDGYVVDAILGVSS
eukprot:scaffold616478_cov18-Prasinocladus_malaysianus.AAC.1